MSTKMEKLEKHAVKLTFEFSADEFRAATDSAYKQTARKYSVPGFRKGKVVPRKLIENAYGESVFYEEALDILFRDNYSAALAEHSIRPYSEPLFDIEQFEEDKPVIFTVEIELMPEITLGQYKNIEINAADYVISEEAIEAGVKKHVDAGLEDMSRMISVDDRAVENGDTVEIDYSGSVDNEKFEGGTAEHQELVIGSNSFIPGFEEQLIGMKLDEEKTITVKFPEDYHAENLKGKDANFEIKLHAIRVKEVPEMNDELVQDISEFSTVDEYMAHTREHVIEELEHEAEHKKHNDAIEKAINNAQIALPETMVRMEAESLAKNNFVRMGFPNTTELDEMCKMFGLDTNEIILQFMDQAVMSLKAEFMFSRIADEEKMDISDEELRDEATKYIRSYTSGAPEEVPEEKIEEMIEMLINGTNRDSFIQHLRLTKASNAVVESIVEK